MRVCRVYEWKTQATNLKMAIAVINVFLPLGKGARNRAGPTRSGPISRWIGIGHGSPVVIVLGQSQQYQAIVW
jgi:hypothetical protein